MSILKHIFVVLLAIFLSWLVFRLVFAAGKGIVGPIGRFIRNSLNIKRKFGRIEALFTLVNIFLCIAIAIITFITLTSIRYLGTDGQIGVAIIQYGLLSWLSVTFLAYTLGDPRPEAERSKLGFIEQQMIEHVKADEEARSPLFQLGQRVLGVGWNLMHETKKQEKESKVPEQPNSPVTELLPKDPNARRIGIIVVHGIGEQKPGDTVSKIESGLKTALAAEACLRAVWGNREGADRCTLVAELKRELRFYEVYWADCLYPTAYGSFDTAIAKELAWFPALNAFGWRRFGATIHTTVLLICAGLLSIANATIDPARLLNFLRFFRFGKKEEKQNISALDPDLNSQKMEDTGYLVKRTWVDRLLDNFAGDIVTYVIAASYYRARGGRVHDSHPAARIYQRFNEKLDIALRDCEEVHVLAHSLGTIIAYHMLTQREPNNKITDIYTIGSPLRKCKAFWPWLCTKITRGHRVRWHNFSNLLDLVSNRRLGLDLGGEVKNHLLLGGGAIQSHVMYERNHSFLRIFTERTLGREISGRGGLGRAGINLLRGLIETVGMPILLLAAVTLGLISIISNVLLGILSYWLLVKALIVAGWVAIGTEMQSAIGWLIIGTVCLVILPIAFTPKNLAERSSTVLRNPPSDLIKTYWF